MEEEKAFKIRDMLKFQSFGEAVRRVRSLGVNEVKISGNYFLRFNVYRRGFDIVCSTNPSLVFPVCPVVACLDFSGGGHRCKHLEAFIKELEMKEKMALDEQQSTVERQRVVQVTSAAKSVHAGIQFNERDIEKLLKHLCEERSLSAENLSTAGGHLNLLNSLGAKEFKDKNRGLVVSRFNDGKSLRIVLPNGSSIFTCATPGCFCSADNLRGGSFYCSRHPEASRSSTIASGTLGAFRNAFHARGLELDPNLDDFHDMSEILWTQVLAEFLKKDETRHSYNGSVVFIYLSKYGQLKYQNKNKDKYIYKCPLPNCLSGVVKEMNNRGKEEHKLFCKRHKDKKADLNRIMAAAVKLSTHRESITIDDSASSSDDFMSKN